MTYFYLAASLMPLEFGDKPDVEFSLLDTRLAENLSPSHYNDFCELKKAYDITNIELLLRKGDLDKRANLSEKELVEALEEKTYFDDIVFEVLEKLGSEENQKSQFASVLFNFFTQQSEKCSGIIKWYFTFERDWRIILSAYRAKKLNVDFDKQLSFIDPQDPLAAHVFSMKDSPHFDPPQGYEDFYEMLLATEQRPKDQHTHLAEYRFRKVKEMMSGNYFESSWVLGYAILLTILEDYHQYSEEKGEEVLNHMMKDSA